MMRFGIGYDLHQTAADRTLILAGVRIPAPFGLRGHSDADVVLHALTDAILGATGRGDIGEWFPDDDPRYEAADSTVLLGEVLKSIRADGWAVVNVDTIIHAEKPKLAVYKPVMKSKLSELLDLPPEAIGLKATTNEGLDAIGQGQAIACWAAALLMRDA
jgi:2-C-methyl-D-erythritol 2,4-cyclodiphosphate synthase